MYKIEKNTWSVIISSNQFTVSICVNEKEHSIDELTCDVNAKQCRTRSFNTRDNVDNSALNSAVVICCSLKHCRKPCVISSINLNHLSGECT